MLEMTVETHITDVARVIQLAIAPVFLLTAVGAIVGVLSARLARIIDRMRVLEERLPNTAANDLTLMHEELAVLGRRLRLVYLAIGLSVVCSLFVGLLIAIAFVGAFLSADLSKFVGLLFIAAMLAFIGSMVVFLREIFLAVNSTRNSVHLREAIRSNATSSSRGEYRLRGSSRVPSSEDSGA